MGSGCILLIAVTVVVAAGAVVVVEGGVLGQDVAEGSRTSDPPISQVTAFSSRPPHPHPEPSLSIPSPPRSSSQPSSLMPLTSSSSEQMRQHHQSPILPVALPEDGNIRTASLSRLTSQQTKTPAEAQAKGPIMTSLAASVVALSFLHKEKIKRCCALRLCPCRGHMGYPGAGPAGMGGFPGPGGMGGGGMYPGMRPGMGMGMGGFRPFGGGGMGGGGGGGEDEGDGELQDGFEDTHTYHVRPGSRPSGMQKRKRPISMRPHHLHPDMAAASAPSPDTNYPAVDQSGGKWTAAGPQEGDVTGSSDHVTGGILPETERAAAAVASSMPISPVLSSASRRRLMSVEMHPPALTCTHEEDMSCSSSIRSLGVGRNSGTNVPDVRRSRIIATVVRNDSSGISFHEAEGMTMHPQTAHATHQYQQSP